MNTSKCVAFFLVLSVILSSCGGTAKRYVGKSAYRKKSNSYSKARKYKTAAVNYARYKSTIGEGHLKRKEIIANAKRYLGVPYRYGGKSAQSGFDCSGFTSYVYQQVGIDVKGASYTQARQGKKKDLSQVSIGDLVVFGNNSKVSHVGIVAEVSPASVKVIHSTSSRGVVIDDITSSQYWRKKYMYAKDIVSR